MTNSKVTHKKDQPPQKEKNFSVIEILKDPIQVAFLLFAAFTLGMLIPFTKAGYDFAEKSKANKPTDYSWPELSDLYLTVLASVGFAIVELAIRKVAYYAFIPFCKEQKNLKLRDIKSQKAAFNIYKFLYFLGASAWGYYVLKDQYYLPPTLGGKGVLMDGFKEFPYSKHASSLKEYILVTMGFHVGGLYTHFFGTRRNDFVEMALHHIVSIYLFGGCYLYNAWEAGAVIAFLHDIADITTSLVKMLVETKMEMTTVVVFLTHMSIWFYTRNVILPLFIYEFYYADFVMGSPIVKPFFCFLLSCLCLLHFYWFSLFVRMLMKYYSNG
mmetsp:Transcript_27664/g.41948  ORF Transcript_27664/g.41948 Transcript_27664/m.41948 type:complete len:327 (-) Transcript_27664:120-1100(-)